MGWSFNSRPCSKKDYVAELVRDQHLHGDNGVVGSQVWIAHSVVGNHLWGVIENRDLEGNATGSFIALDLLQQMDGCWGNKSMSESMGPSYYDCPLKYLNMVPLPQNSQYAGSWREQVREFHALKQQRVKLAPGQFWSIKGTPAGDTCTIVTKSAHGSAWIIDIKGGHYRASSKRLNGMLVEMLAAS